MINYILDIKDRKDLVLITDSQDCEQIRKDFNVEYDSFFVSTENGSYIEVYGFFGIVPHLYKPLFLVYR